MRNILLLLVLLIAGTWWMRQNERKRNADRMRPPPANDTRTNARRSLPPAERMVRCSECDTYLPESEAIASAGGKHFCSGAHRDAYLTRDRRV
ncbi:PP0621 family protein [Pandoraea sp.]|uniref:PP0621 family protein n=1 Tax=Pandoraea sp. TaxID=1883445 RepID=UPI0035B3372F